MNEEDIRTLPADAKSTRCKYHNGQINERCAAGVRYEDVALDHPPIRYRDGRAGSSVYSSSRSFPCLGKYNHGGATCPKLELPTLEELDADEVAHKRTMDLMKRGLSDCCESPINESRVIQSGRHKGHGPRYCGKCGRCVFIV